MGDTILSEWEHQIWFGLLEVESHKIAEFEQETISLEERVVDRDRQFTYVLKISLFPQVYALYINGFCNSEQFDSIFLDCAYQLVESVVSHGKYEDNM